MADDSGESESYGSYVVDNTDKELEPNLTDEQDINKGRQRSDSETTKDEDDKEGTKRRKRPASRTPLPTAIPIYDARGRVQLGLYQCFKDNKHFRECLVSYAVEQGFELQKVNRADPGSPTGVLQRDVFGESMLQLLHVSYL